jgi:LmbE family N-acetylglucosaminyl deacetylase
VASGRGGRFDFSSAAVIVAHPDDETLWAGGLILMHPGCRWTVVALCRASDPDRAPKFRRVLALLGAAGDLGDLDDGADQASLPDGAVAQAVVGLLPSGARFDLVLTHGPHGEYTRHRRHEEASRAVAGLWTAGKLQAGALWMFAYEDGGGSHLARAVAHAHRTETLPDGVWQEKRRIVTDLYGFGPESVEARTTPAEEGFWCFGSPAAYERWLRENG